MTEASSLRAASRAATAALAVIATAVLLWLVTTTEPRTWTPPPPTTPITLAGEHYRVAPDELEWLRSFSTLHFAEGEQMARELAAEEIDARLDGVFAAARARLPEFADWYYSLRGEYARLAMAALALADVAPENYLEKRATELLLPEQAWREELARLHEATAARLASHHANVRAGWLAEITRRLAPRHVPATVAASPSPNGIDLDALVAQVWQREQTAFAGRISVSTLAAAGAAAASAAAARTAATAGRTAAAIGSRGAVRLGSRIGAAAAGGATLCAASGPGALACALVAGAAAWVGTDAALLAIDERLHRESLLSALEDSLSEIRAQMRSALLASYDRLIEAQYGAMQRQVESAFVPAGAGAPSR